MSDSAESPKPLDVYDLIPFVLEQMASVSWQKLGLQPDPMTGRIEQDLSQARVAIDIVGYLTGILEKQVDEPDKQQLQNLVRDLKVNFVQQSTNIHA